MKVFALVLPLCLSAHLSFADFKPIETTHPPPSPNWTLMPEGNHCVRLRAGPTTVDRMTDQAALTLGITDGSQLPVFIGKIRNILNDASAHFDYLVTLSGLSPEFFVQAIRQLFLLKANPNNEQTTLANFFAIVKRSGDTYSSSVVQAMSEVGIGPNDRVLLVGFSLGGIVAQVLATSGRLPNVMHVITFGAPIATSPLTVPYNVEFHRFSIRADPVVNLLPARWSIVFARMGAKVGDFSDRFFPAPKQGGSEMWYVDAGVMISPNLLDYHDGKSYVASKELSQDFDALGRPGHAIIQLDQTKSYRCTSAQVPQPQVRETDCPQFYYRGEPPAVAPDRYDLLEKNREICYQQFGVVHSGVMRVPIWSAEHLTAAIVRQAQDLPQDTRAFHAEDQAGIPSEEIATLQDYVALTPRFVRGHATPHADMPTRPTQAESDTLANIMPQDASNNSGIWNNIENVARRLACREEIYVVTGAGYATHYDQTKYNAIPGRVKVPDIIWKAVYSVTRNYAGAYVMDNTVSPHGFAFLSLNELEQDVGLDVFPSLPDALKHVSSRGGAGPLPPPNPSRGKPCP